MNERLEELKKQSMIRVNNPTVNTDGKIVCDNWEEGISLSKFAELIVQECANINYNSPFQDGEFHAREVLEHFGVEE